MPRRAPTAAASCTYDANAGVATACTARTSSIDGMWSFAVLSRGGFADRVGLSATSFLRSAHDYIARIWPWQRATTEGDNPSWFSSSS